VRGNWAGVIIKGQSGSRKGDGGWEPIPQRVRFPSAPPHGADSGISAEGSNLGRRLVRYLLDFWRADWGNLEGL